MTILQFPPVDLADEHGLIAIGGDLEVESLVLAYRSGIFPWPVNDEYLTWFAPPQRAILKYSDLHVSRSLKRSRSRDWASFSINRNFKNVIASCQELINRKDQGGTWITDDIREAFIDFHQAGHAHSFECYREGKLVGGVYGVLSGGVFSAESMFYRVSDASKLALWFMMDYLMYHKINWVDVQVMTPLLANFGARDINREQFMLDLADWLPFDNKAFQEIDSRSLTSILPNWSIADGFN